MLRVVFLLCLLCFVHSAFAAPKAELWTRWQVHDETSRQSVDHGAWHDFLKVYVRPGADGINRVAYGDVTGAHRAALDGYIKNLTHTRVSFLNKAEQCALWINLYNATTIRVVLDHYPVESIRDIDISPGFFANGPWGKKLLTVEGQELSLDDIEHRILRPIWRDARLHYALNCAALGCPNLQRTAFSASNADSLLDAAARAFINHPRGVRLEDGRLYVSSIYDWFGEDFGGSDAGVITHLRQFSLPKLLRQLVGVTHIAGDDYDWRLNDAR